MSTLAEVEAALPQLTAAELTEVERLARQVRRVKESREAAAATISQGSTRPKVGEMLDATAPIPDSAFLPLTDDELKAWGL